MCNLLILEVFENVQATLDWFSENPWGQTPKDLPCGTNWVGDARREAKIGADDVIGKLVKLGREVVSDRHLLGFMMASWSPCDTEENTRFNLRGVDLLADALDGRIAEPGPLALR